MEELKPLMKKISNIMGHQYVHPKGIAKKVGVKEEDTTLAMKKLVVEGVLATGQFPTKDGIVTLFRKPTAPGGTPQVVKITEDGEVGMEEVTPTKEG